MFRQQEAWSAHSGEGLGIGKGQERPGGREGERRET